MFLLEGTRRAFLCMCKMAEHPTGTKMNQAQQGFEIIKAAIDSSSLPNSTANRENDIQKGGKGSGRKKGSKDKKKRKSRSNSIAKFQKDYRNPKEASA